MGVQQKDRFKIFKFYKTHQSLKFFFIIAATVNNSTFARCVGHDIGVYFNWRKNKPEYFHDIIGYPFTVPLSMGTNTNVPWEE